MIERATENPGTTWAGLGVLVSQRRPPAISSETTVAPSPPATGFARRRGRSRQASRARGQNQAKARRSASRPKNQASPPRCQSRPARNPPTPRATRRAEAPSAMRRRPAATAATPPRRTIRPVHESLACQAGTDFRVISTGSSAGIRGRLTRRGARASRCCAAMTAAAIASSVAAARAARPKKRRVPFGDRVRATPARARTTIPARVPSPFRRIAANPVAGRTGCGGATVPPTGNRARFSSPERCHSVFRTGAPTRGRARVKLDESAPARPRRRRTSAGVSGSADPGRGMRVISPSCRAFTVPPPTATDQRRVPLGRRRSRALRARDFT